MRNVGWIVLAATGAAIAAVTLVLIAHIRLSVVLSLGAGALCLLWLVLLLTVPWNLYFQARHILHELPESRERGLAIPAGREEEARRIAVRLRRMAVGAHLLSAALMTVVGYFSGDVVGYWFAGFYLVGTLLRPAQAYFAHMRGQLAGMLRETRFPREDVLAFTHRLTLVEDRAKSLSRADLELGARVHETGAQSSVRDKALDARIHSLERRFESLGRRFEETVSELTDNHEVIDGIKAFLRLLRTERA